MLKRLKKDPTDMMNIRVGVLKGGSFRPAPEVEKPTYKVLGEIERVDQRDTAHSRIDVWKPGSKKYEDYYTNLHPEWKEMDDETKAMAYASSKRRQTASSLSLSWLDFTEPPRSACPPRSRRDSGYGRSRLQILMSRMKTEKLYRYAWTPWK